MSKGKGVPLPLAAEAHFARAYERCEEVLRAIIVSPGAPFAGGKGPQECP